MFHYRLLHVSLTESLFLFTRTDAEEFRRNKKYKNKYKFFVQMSLNLDSFETYFFCKTVYRVSKDVKGDNSCSSLDSCVYSRCCIIVHFHFNQICHLVQLQNDCQNARVNPRHCFSSPLTFLIPYSGLICWRSILVL